MNPGVKGGEKSAAPQLCQNNESFGGWEVGALLPIKVFFHRLPFRKDTVRAVVSCAAFMAV